MLQSNKWRQCTGIIFHHVYVEYFFSYVYVCSARKVFFPPFLCLTYRFYAFSSFAIAEDFSRASSSTQSRGTECKLHGVKSSNYIFPLDKGGKLWHISGRFQLKARKLTRGMGSLRHLHIHEMKGKLQWEWKIKSSHPPVKVEWKWKTSKQHKKLIKLSSFASPPLACSAKSDNSCMLTFQKHSLRLIRHNNEGRKAENVWKAFRSVETGENHTNRNKKCSKLKAGWIVTMFGDLPQFYCAE